jgi:two-component system, NtrC family, nitrogen regulation sensor histidine kinase NtrY
MIVVQAILLALTPALFALGLDNENLVITRFNLVILWLFQIGFLIWYLQKPGRQLASLLEIINVPGQISSLDEKKKTVFGLNVEAGLGRITESVNRLRIEKEREFHLYRNCIASALTGLIAFDDRGEILVVNRAFLSLLGRERIESIEKIDEIKEGLSDWIVSVKSDTQKLITVITGGKILKIYISVSVFRQDNRIVRVMALQDITPGIASQELESMHRFLRMMSHEILNSVSPMSLMSSGLIRKYREAPPCDECGGAAGMQRDEIIGVMDTIRKRSRGLASFVEDFRKTYHIPQPVLQQNIPVSEMFGQVERLLDEQLKEQGIRLEVKFESGDLQMTADRKLVEQALINLVLNSAEAVKNINDPLIFLECLTENDRTELLVTDNGCGMDIETLEKLSLPFFTTREKGTGSGLFFSRQVMRLHKGELIILSEKNKGTTVKLVF